MGDGLVWESHIHAFAQPEDTPVNILVSHIGGDSGNRQAPADGIIVKGLCDMNGAGDEVP